MLTLGAYIRQARLDQHLSQKAVAASLGISAGYLHDLEVGYRRPSDRLLLKLAQRYQVSYDYLCWLTGKLPLDIQAGDYSPEQVVAAVAAFRAALQGGGA